MVFFGIFMNDMYLSFTILLISGLILFRLMWWDFKEFILPDGLIFLYGCLGVLNFYLFPLSFYEFSDYIIGSIFCGSVFWFIRIFMSYSLKKEALGFGDVKLAFAIGLWIGWMPIWFFMLLSVVIGLLIWCFYLLKGLNSEEKFVPFGPALCISAWIISIFHFLGFQFDPYSIVNLLI